MTDPRYGASQHPAGERWNVNMPAVIGVVFVFLVGVIVWVIATSGDGESSAPSASTTLAPADGVTPVASVSTTGTTSPAPMPSTIPEPTPASSSTTEASTSSTTSTTVAPTVVTAAPDAGPGAVPGDLAIPGRPMQQPGCDGSYITVLASAVGDQASGTGIANLLEAYPGSSYLRTDQTCPSLTPDLDGEPIYVVYFGPFAFESDACTARAEGPEGAYARMLSTEVGPDHSVACA